LVPNRPRILPESVANRWKIGQENSLGQTSVFLDRGSKFGAGLTGFLPPPFSCTQFAKGQQRAKAGEKKAALAREFSISSISWETLYQYLNA